MTEENSTEQYTIEEVLSLNKIEGFYLRLWDQGLHAVLQIDGRSVSGPVELMVAERAVKKKVLAYTGRKLELYGHKWNDVYSYLYERYAMTSEDYALKFEHIMKPYLYIDTSSYWTTSDQLARFHQMSKLSIALMVHDDKVCISDISLYVFTASKRMNAFREFINLDVLQRILIKNGFTRERIEIGSFVDVMWTRKLTGNELELLDALTKPIEGKNKNIIALQSRLRVADTAKIDFLFSLLDELNLWGVNLDVVLTKLWNHCLAIEHPLPKNMIQFRVFVREALKDRIYNNAVVNVSG